MKLPTHICLSIQHNGHAGAYQSIDEYLEQFDVEECPPDDRAAILASGEIWEINWCPRTPVGSCVVAAATLERALELANQE